jgi:hypothetical protein
MPIPVSVPWTALTGYPLIGNNLAASDDLQTLIVGGMEEGVYRSTNGGATWAQCDPANARLKNASQYISSPTSSPRPRRIGWAKLLARGFALDITRCRKCGGRMRVLEVVSDPDAIARILHGARALACASSSRPAPVAPLTARPFGDVFTLPRPTTSRPRLAGVSPTRARPLPSSLPLSGSSPHTSSRARFPSRPGPCQNLPTAGSAAAHRTAGYSPSPPNSRIELLKHAPRCRPCCPSRAHGCALPRLTPPPFPRAQDLAKVSRPRALHTHPRAQNPTFKRLSAPRWCSRATAAPSPRCASTTLAASPSAPATTEPCTSGRCNTTSCCASPAASSVATSATASGRPCSPASPRKPSAASAEPSRPRSSLALHPIRPGTLLRARSKTDR